MAQANFVLGTEPQPQNPHQTASRGASAPLLQPDVTRQFFDQGQELGRRPGVHSGRVRKHQPAPALFGPAAFRGNDLALLQLDREPVGSLRNLAFSADDAGDRGVLGNHHHGDQTPTTGGDQIAVKLEKRCTCLHPVPHFDSRSKTLAVQLDRIDADVHEHFQSVAAAYGQRMQTAVQLDDLSGTRCLENGYGRIDGVARTRQSLREYRIGNLAQRQSPTRQRCLEDDLQCPQPFSESIAQAACEGSGRVSLQPAGTHPGPLSPGPGRGSETPPEKRRAGPADRACPPFAQGWRRPFAG